MKTESGDGRGVYGLFIVGFFLLLGGVIGYAAGTGGAEECREQDAEDARRIEHREEPMAHCRIYEPVLDYDPTSSAAVQFLGHGVSAYFTDQEILNYLRTRSLASVTEDQLVTCLLRILRNSEEDQNE